MSYSVSGYDGLGAGISFTLDETGLTTTSTADRPPDPTPIPITTTTSGTSVIGAILTAAHLEHDKAVAAAEAAAAAEKAAQFDAARTRAIAAHAAKVVRDQAAAAKAVADAKAKTLAARLAASTAAAQLTLAQWQSQQAAQAEQAPMKPAPEEAGSKTGLYVGLALAALVIGSGALLLLGKKKPAAATATANRRRRYRGNPRERAVYATSFCNFGHDLRTGRPVGHECEILPPAALRAEREGDVPRSIEILEQHRRRYGRRYVRGRALKPNRRCARRR